MQQTPKDRVVFVQWFLIGLTIVSLVFIAIVMPAPAKAETFPSDAITVSIRNETAVDHLNVLFLDNTDMHIRTIHAIAVQQQTAKESTVYCGTNATGTGRAMFDAMISTNTSFQRQMQEKCDLPIYVDNMRTTFLGMTYSDRDVATSYDPTDLLVGINNTLGEMRYNGIHLSTMPVVPYAPPTLGQASTTPFFISNTTTNSSRGFTYGEVMVILLLIMIFCILFFSTLKEWLFGVRIENQQNLEKVIVQKILTKR